MNLFFELLSKGDMRVIESLESTVMQILHSGAGVDDLRCWCRAIYNCRFSEIELYRDWYREKYTEIQCEDIVEWQERDNESWNQEDW
jgi:hypothetical protein